MYILFTVSFVKRLKKSAEDDGTIVESLWVNLRKLNHFSRGNGTAVSDNGGKSLPHEKI